MENNEQNYQEAPQMETPDTKTTKAKTARRSTKKTAGNANNSEGKKTSPRTRNSRAKKTLKDKNAEEQTATEKEAVTAVTTESNATEPDTACIAPTTQTESEAATDTAVSEAAPKQATPAEADVTEQQNAQGQTDEKTTVTDSEPAKAEQKEQPEQQKQSEQKELKALKEQQEERRTPKETNAQHEKPAQKETARQQLTVPALPHIRISNIIELLQAPMRSIVLTDQQIQQLTLEQIEERHRFLEETLARVLDYDVVISDTNIWLELLIGYTSSHSDPKYNARLQFERQLEFISKLTHFRNGRFMILGETYEEIDRFASMLDPANHRDADFTDNIVCLNTAARLAKRLILAQQRENRLRIDGIGAESHHAAFADPAIIRKVAELFATGKKVLLLTNDASVAIRAMGICDDLQRHNNIPDSEWDEKYAPLRPMVFTFDDLKQLDFYTKQYHYIQMAAGVPWMNDIERTIKRDIPAPLELNIDAFKPGDKHRSDNLFNDQEKQQGQQKLLQQKKQMEQKKQEQAQKKQEQSQKQQQAQQKKAQTKQKPEVKPAPAEQTVPKATNTASVNTANAAPTEENAAVTTEAKPKPRTRRKPQRKKASGDKAADNSQQASANE